MNMRGKIELDITDNHAGCYEGCLLLDPENYKDPAQIRACINGGVPYTRQTASQALPWLFASCPMAFITSWASFPWELSPEIGVSRQLLHMPCMDMPDMMDVAVVFKPLPDRLAVLYLAKRATPEDLLGEGSVLGASVDLGLFPLSERSQEKVMGLNVMTAAVLVGIVAMGCGWIW